MKTRILFLIALLLGVLLFSCAAAEKIGDYEVELNPDGTATITAYTGVPADVLEVPAEVVMKTEVGGENRVPVTGIGNGVFSGCAMTTVSLPDGIERIGRNPFQNCPNLSAIRVSPDCKGLAVIDGVLFSKADKRLVCYPAGLEQDAYAIPDGIRSIDAGAFPGTIERYDSETGVRTMIQRGPSSLLIPGSVEEIPDNAFRFNRNLTEVTIREGVTAIGQSAFFGTSLVSIDIPESVSRIGEYAFAGCHSLTSVSIPESVTVIEHGTFYSCDQLKSIMLPHGLKRIGLQEYSPISQHNAFVTDGAFARCTNLTSITIPDGVEVIGEYTFSRCTSLTSVSIPAGVTRIGAGAFNGCEGLTEIVIPDGVTEIGESAFACCSGLTSVVIPDSVTDIADNLFAAVTNMDIKFSKTADIRSNLTSVTLGKGVTRIGESAFFRCNKLAEIVIPDSVTSIGNIAFQGCSSLKSIRIPAGVTEIGPTAFFNMNYKPNTDILIIVDRDSYAAQYCKEIGLNYTYPDALDWLNN